MTYLLDTNVVVALLRNKPLAVRDRYRATLASGDSLGLSSVVLFELWYGVAKSSQVQENTERLRVLLSGDFDGLQGGDEVYYNEDVGDTGPIATKVRVKGKNLGTE